MDDRESMEKGLNSTTGRLVQLQFRYWRSITLYWVQSGFKYGKTYSLLSTPREKRLKLTGENINASLNNE